MYLANLNLKNWRSYADVQFDFNEPEKSKSMVLIGAMNGHGKTSFLVSLYLGLFGKYGLRHCEGFSKNDSEDMGHYRGAIDSFRRNQANADEPTVIDITFKPSRQDDEKEEEVRVVRRWFFTNNNTPKQGDNFEQLDVYVGGRLQGRTDPDELHLEKGHARIERNLFPAHLAPAFFFDGEQAQGLIDNMGEKGLKKAVEVMFGTRVIEDATERVRRYLITLRGKAGGKRKLSEQEKDLNIKNEQRDEVNEQISKLQKDLSEFEQEKDAKDANRTELRNQLVRLGGNQGTDVAAIHAAFAQAQSDQADATKNLSEQMSQLGLALAVSRMGEIVEKRLVAEESRESWEGIKRGVLESKEQVLAVALPEPPDTDLLLGNLSASVRVQVKNRFEKALDQVYDPPPPDCASEYILGHVKGEARNQVRQDLQQVRSCAGQTLTTAARRLRDSNDSFEDATRKKNRLEGQPKEIQTLSDQISGLDGEISGLIHKVGATENKITTLKADLHTLNADIGRLQDLLSRLGPEQQRMAVAERLAQAFEDLQEDLRPTTAKRIEEKVTKHFLKIADARYKGGIIRLPENELPYIEHPTNAQSIESMSGFERRSFGIAFSLALVEIIRRRIPLIIDTPIGNADGEYRIRTLKAWAEFDADQVIILTHDKEVDLALAHEVADSLNQCFLVKFKGSQQGSLIEPNTYFKK